ncbi:MAG: dihydropteroate synthase, partial [Clostridia bacterium]|nr:dihydropteroate synthase [Clostridia bacterium]
LLEGMRADAIGVNCSLGPQALAPVVREYLKYASVPVLLKPNAGMPRVQDGQTVYDVMPDAFAQEVQALLREGVRLAGGCCGTTPQYIRALTQTAVQLVPVREKAYSCVSSYSHAVFFGKEPVLIGERINPTGKKPFKEALRAHDIGYLLREGIAQQDQGAQVLDVNVGLPEIDETEMLTTAVCELQAIIDLPLQIDTSNVCAMEAALRRYNGKAMINSVNGKQSSMDAVFPLVQKYGGLVVALTLDENGIPETAQGRVEIARRILAEAATYGIAPKNLIFDPLAMAVSARPEAAKVTLESVARIHNELGCRTSLGVSNVSFGLPQRDLINSTFFAMALQCGLDAAIMNPYSAEMMKTFYACRALNGLDEGFASYIAFAQQTPAAQPAAPAAVPAVQAQEGSALQQAIVRGLREQAALLTDELLSGTQPLCIVQQEIIPALNRVGVGFENKTVYLPQLLMSAEAAKAAFERIKTAMPAGGGAAHGPFVLATVQGDIHDIGKNIVRLLLENYGFQVVDLGRDVAPETVAETVVRLHAPLAGLSALMTTTVPAMEKTIRLLHSRAPWCRVIVGGAVLTQEYAHRIGADAYARDAMEVVRAAEAMEP